MIKILLDGEALDIPASFSIDIEDNSPVFNDDGSQSLSSSIPLSRRNSRLLGYPHLTDSGADPAPPTRTVRVDAGNYMRDGLLNVTEASRSEGITFNIGFDNSTAYSRWQARTLSDIAGNKVWTPPASGAASPMDAMMEAMRMAYVSPQPRPEEFAVFPVLVGREEVDSEDSSGNETKKVYWEILNDPDTAKDSFRTSGKVTRVIDGEVTEVSVPDGYGVTPFLRVWKILEMVFADLGMGIAGGNPFRDDPDLARVVVLNNTADAVCLGKVYYRDLMPDCTVQEFLNALWVRFGCVCHVNFDTGAATVRLLRDILNTEPVELPGVQESPERISYGERQYLKLSAQTGLEGAAPECDRWEDFSKGIDLRHIHTGADVREWKNEGSRNYPQWDGEIYDDYYGGDYDPDRDGDPEPPDWWDDRDDDRDMDTRSIPRAPASRASSVPSTAFLSREFVSGIWYRLDSLNSAAREASSPFFSWDPQPEGYEAMELSSDDECVPVDAVFNTVNSEGYADLFTARMPYYLVGARHYHSYVKGADAGSSGNSDDSGESTPLAFVMALNAGDRTVGRNTPEDDLGLATVCADVNEPCRLSLLWQFADGLFARFWRDYDEILRHGNRTVAVSVMMSPCEAQRVDLLRPVVFRGVRCLMDRMEYTLPGAPLIKVTYTLRPIQTQGKYDIVKEQSIPEVLCARVPQV